MLGMWNVVPGSLQPSLLDPLLLTRRQAQLSTERPVLCHWSVRRSVWCGENVFGNFYAKLTESFYINWIYQELWASILCLVYFTFLVIFSFCFCNELELFFSFFFKSGPSSVVWAAVLEPTWPLMVQCCVQGERSDVLCCCIRSALEKGDLRKGPSSVWKRCCRFVFTYVICLTASQQDESVSTVT